MEMPLSTGLLGWQAVNLDLLVIHIPVHMERHFAEWNNTQREAEMRGERDLMVFFEPKDLTIPEQIHCWLSQLCEPINSLFYLRLFELGFCNLQLKEFR